MLCGGANGRRSDLVVAEEHVEEQFTETVEVAEAPAPEPEKRAAPTGFAGTGLTLPDWFPFGGRKKTPPPAPVVEEVAEEESEEVDESAEDQTEASEAAEGEEGEGEKRRGRRRRT